MYNKLHKRSLFTPGVNVPQGLVLDSSLCVIDLDSNKVTLPHSPASQTLILCFC